MKRAVALLGGLLAAAALLGSAAAGAAAGALHTLNYAFPVAETGFDPTRLSDLYSRTVTANIFEALYGYDFLARPALIRPLTALALPEVADNFKSFTIRLRPGIYFQDDPAFKGQPRELVAEDYVYSFKRFADPANKSPSWGSLEELGILGLAEQRQRALSSRQAFDYAPVLPGLRALDRYTLQIRVAEARPRLLESLADNGLRGAWPAGGAARRWCSSATPATASATTKTRPRPTPTTPRVRRCWRASRAGACRWSTAWWCR
jgi:ABC-type transport system substrate-binding protein